MLSRCRVVDPHPSQSAREHECPKPTTVIVTATVIDIAEIMGILRVVMAIVMVVVVAIIVIVIVIMVIVIVILAIVLLKAYPRP